MSGNKQRIDTGLTEGGLFASEDRAKVFNRTNETSNKLSIRPRSIYIGSGLGMRQDEEPAFNPKGSAKIILKDILRQHELENR